jgi:hypothetical protein
LVVFDGKQMIYHLVAKKQEWNECLIEIQNMVLLSHLDGFDPIVLMPGFVLLDWVAVF